SQPWSVPEAVATEWATSGDRRFPVRREYRRSANLTAPNKGGGQHGAISSMSFAWEETPCSSLDVTCFAGESCWVEGPRRPAPVGSHGPTISYRARRPDPSSSNLPGPTRGDRPTAPPGRRSP